MESLTMRMLQKKDPSPEEGEGQNVA